MPATTIVPDDVLSRLLDAGPQRIHGPGDPEEFERITGLFDPTPELLREVIDAVFFASLSAEEGRSVLTRVVLTNAAPPCQLEPRAVSAAALRKLAPLMDEPSNVLYVRNDAKISGVGSSSMGVCVAAHRPGRLVVYESSVLGVFDEGNWVIVNGGEINFSHILQRALPQESFPDRLLKATLVVRLAMGARRIGRGAAFVLVPTDRREGIASVAYPVQAFPPLPQALDAWRRVRAATPHPLQHEQIRHLVAIARAIAAAGAGIDGATLIDNSSLELLGFGAKIDVPDDELEIAVIEVPPTEVRKAKKKELGGMRHQMAARLVQLNHDAIVITVSQDGSISLFAWVNEDACVVVLRHLDRYLAASA